MKFLIVALVAVLTLPGCAPSHEEACLDSIRMTLKDPDSAVVVANLGGRGLVDEKEGYFLRYKAKNGYGAYVSGNMYCSKTSDYDHSHQSVRNVGNLARELAERTVTMKISNQCLLLNMKHRDQGRKPFREDCDEFALEEFNSTGSLAWFFDAEPSRKQDRPNWP